MVGFVGHPERKQCVTEQYPRTVREASRARRGLSLTAAQKFLGVEDRSHFRRGLIDVALAPPSGTGSAPASCTNSQANTRTSANALTLRQLLSRPQPANRGGGLQRENVPSPEPRRRPDPSAAIALGGLHAATEHRSQADTLEFELLGSVLWAVYVSPRLPAVASR